MDALARLAAALALASAAAAGQDLLVRVELRDPATGEVLSAPSVTVPSGETAAISVVRPDGRGFHARLTPRLLTDGSVELRHDLALGLPRPEPGRATRPLETPRFHSAIPSEGLFSVECPGRPRAWLRIGQTSGEWTLEGFDPARLRLTLARKGERLSLALAAPSAAEAEPMLVLRRGEVTSLPLRGGAGEASVRVEASAR